jgi:hypothetical protein
MSFQWLMLCRSVGDRIEVTHQLSLSHIEELSVPTSTRLQQQWVMLIVKIVKFGYWPGTYRSRRERGITVIATI